MATPRKPRKAADTPAPETPSEPAPPTVKEQDAPSGVTQHGNGIFSIDY